MLLTFTTPHIQLVLPFKETGGTPSGMELLFNTEVYSSHLNHHSSQCPDN